MYKPLRVYFLFVALLAISISSTVSPANDILLSIVAKLSQYRQAKPQEKLYLHLDKPLYVVGEDIWFKVYQVEASFHQLRSMSHVIYVELLDANQTVLNRHVLYSEGGVAHGDFRLDTALTQGHYLIRAYTNYMRNTGEDFFFAKEITVLNSRKQANKRPVTGTLDLQFFPEGGTFLAGVQNHVAFKATDHYGRGVSVKGTITNENNEIISSFETEHDGMGVVKITPTTAAAYKATFTSATGVTGITLLPTAEEEGYHLHTIEDETSIKIIISAKSNTQSSLAINLVAQSRGVVVYAGRGNTQSGQMIATIAKNVFPSGITQITLFDNKGIPQCERLIFVDQNESLSIQPVTHKITYAKREFVEMTIETRGAKSSPVSGNFSIAIYDAEVKSTQDHSSGIVSHLLLTSDLTGRIDNPQYYISSSSPQVIYHRDLLMMTHGWRRFTWKQVLTDDPAPLRYSPEKGIRISGHVTKSLSKKASINSEISLLATNGTYTAMKTDSAGRFYSDELLYYDSTEMVIQTNNAKGKQVPLQFTLDPFNPSPTSHCLVSPLLSDTSLLIPNKIEERNRVMRSYTIGKGVTVLEEVKVAGNKIEENKPFKIYGTPDHTIKMDNTSLGYTSVLQFLQGRVPGLFITGAPPNMSISIRGGGPPLFILDGMPLYDSSLDLVMYIPPADVESIDILKGASAAMYGSQGANGVIAIYTKRGDGGYSYPSVGIHQTKYPGFYRAREFYSPNYAEPTDDHNLPDLRTTLYWNPNITTDEQGKAVVSFHTSDVATSYRVVVEGISNEGIPGYGEYMFEVK